MEASADAGQERLQQSWRFVINILERKPIVDNEVAVSFRVNFEGDAPSDNALYAMEKVLTGWLRDAVAKGDTETLHKQLEDAAGRKVPEFFLFVVADLS